MQTNNHNVKLPFSDVSINYVMWPVEEMLIKHTTAESCTNDVVQ